MRALVRPASLLLAAIPALAPVPVLAKEGMAREGRPKPPPAKEVRAALKQLEEKDPKRREEAAGRIAEIAMDFPGEILPGLPVDAADPEVRKLARSLRSAFEILGERGGVGKFTDDEFHAAMGVLEGVREAAMRRLLAHKSNRTRQAATEAIFKRGWKDLAPLAAERALTDPDAVVRLNAFGILESFRDPARLREAMLGLRDGDTTVRGAARQAFDRLKEASGAASELERLLADRDPFVRRQAAEALGGTKDRARAVALHARMLSEKDDEVKRALFAAIDRLVGGEGWSSEGVSPEVAEVRAWWERNRRKFR